MKEHPILMNGAMERATLAGAKTQTRRIIKPQPQMVTDKRIEPWQGDPAALLALLAESGRKCPYGQAGDQIWVRETLGHHVDKGHYYAATGMHVGPLLDYELEPSPSIGIPARTIPSIHMPRWAARILLEIVSVRVERLQDISDAYIVAEGIDIEALAESQDRYDVVCKGSGASGRATERTAWRDLWELTGGDWDANEWLWAIEFKRVTP
ncbi:hypothetical protein [Janthinobacterium lividum]|uniref:hypothetical protein n=1 Tax=Janthinobacterium lividum TaxID=29581 RepID=UPI001B821E8B|nr:hypothetical protein [Janthinobacterium lividum]MBR7634874.1 hypothetical protein [Janthinobacterium lividum]